MSRHDDQLRYYNLYTPHPDEVVSQLADKIVCVIGLGGIGSELVRHLSVAGVGTLICVDGDTVEPSNLNRQVWFSPGDVGLPKAECLARRVSIFAPQTQARSVCAFVNSRRDLQKVLEASGTCDFIACCADEPVGTIEAICLGIAKDIGAQVGMAAMNLRRGYWAVFPDSSATAAAGDLFLTAAAIAKRDETKSVRGSASWTNAVISAFFAEAIIAALAGLPYSNFNKLTAFDFNRMQAEITADFMLARHFRQESDA
ncbi:ThiF family adenylyltransferase [Cereibacter sphaeroides]|uniref:ThiF family adenylyltransferase n=1 Tax=Cereibacter sphaeroides TaxID=1063 RepID=UPI00142D1F45|nr:ThiF family adenylyltransferase [Cereibacter sphaeroides]